MSNLEKLTNKELSIELIERLRDTKHPRHIKFDKNSDREENEIDLETRQNFMTIFKLMACRLEAEASLELFKHDNEDRNVIIYLKKTIERLQKNREYKNLDDAYKAGWDKAIKEYK